MSEWEYRKIDLNQHRPQRDEVDLLNAAGADGWQLVSLTSNNFAYLKRELEDLAQARTAHPEMSTPLTRDTSAASNGARAERSQEVKAMYREPVTNETWSGRGRITTVHLCELRRERVGRDLFNGHIRPVHHE